MILWSYAKDNVLLQVIKTDNSTFEVIELENETPKKSMLCSSYEEAHDLAFKLINSYDTN